MRILFINPLTAKVEVPSIPPLGLAYLAAVLREDKHDVQIIDYDLERDQIDSFEQTIHSYKPNIIGLSAMTLQINNAFLLAQRVKQVSKDILVVFGGAHPSALPEQTLQEAKGNVDIVVIGEGEMTILDIAQSKPVRDINGIAYIKDGSVIRTAPRPFIADLDALPFPARDLLKINKYRGWGPLRTTPSTHLISSRGCPFECVFCSEKAVFGRGYRARSAEKIIDEIKCLVNTYGMKEVAFYDDLFTLDKKRVIEICDELDRQKITIDWKALSRVNTIDLEMLSRMRQAGCWLISYGFESGSPEVLSAIKKHQTVEQSINAAELTRKAGIKFYGFFMIGNIGETQTTVLRTISLARRLKPDYLQFTIVRPDPGSFLYNKHKMEIEKAHTSWEEYYAFSRKTNAMPVVDTSLTISELLDLRHIAYILTSAKMFCVFLIKATVTFKVHLLWKFIAVLFNKDLQFYAKR
jgi:radical SAM superfamily enzyme YgiQ (UPF0313 family)